MVMSVLLFILFVVVAVIIFFVCNGISSWYRRVDNHLKNLDANSAHIKEIRDYLNDKSDNNYDKL